MEGEGASHTNGNAGEGGAGTPVLGLLLQGMGMGGQQDAYNSYMSPMGGMGMGPMGGMGMGMGGMGGMSSLGMGMGMGKGGFGMVSSSISTFYQENCSGSKRWHS